LKPIICRGQTKGDPGLEKKLTFRASKERSSKLNLNTTFGIHAHINLDLGVQ
jgi:hypothetical protein